MVYPFFPSPPTLVNTVLHIAEYLGLSTLPLHIHEVILGWTYHHLIDTIVSPVISTWLFPSVYPRLPARTMISWNKHVTSFGYTGARGAVQGFAAGYFLWDLIASILHLNVLGWGSLAHARPFANYYDLNFILYELSTPFLNIHWFFDKLNITGSQIQLYNSIALLATFFSCRVLWGNYQSINIYSNVWTALHTQTLDSPITKMIQALVKRFRPPKSTPKMGKRSFEKDIGSCSRSQTTEHLLPRISLLSNRH
ncbi:hypothetical protein DL98DRAFT_552137 [Cadophora sp. DSE1049]|nr:hypothetical protein DL98DRAFT_552137 [Cadophora sp. DSE1049]